MNNLEILKFTKPLLFYYIVFRKKNNLNINFNEIMKEWGIK